ncbi:MAG: TrkA family potassium uptake protein [Actinomycetota bacterium]|nr:TrkA family potassium uptake protein [Actinomycetota bacterium]MDA3013117.1 TrkA family potassium uptake protein [Actinomycetota bacterium]
MKVIIIGAQGEAKELINRISSGWSVAVIDLDQEKLRNFTTNRQIEKIQGDGTSTLVLKKAGIEDASALITLTSSDEVNLEVLNLAKQKNILRLSSVVNERKNIEKFKELDVEIVDSDVLVARRFEHILEPRRVVSQAFAGGRAEAIEIEITSDSPVRGKSLKEIGSDFYIVGAIFRKGKVIIPHGDTIIETEDLVTVVLQSGAFSSVINLFSGSESRFPLEFGKDILVILESEESLKNLSEAEYFIRNTKAASLKVLSNSNLFSNKLEPTEDTIRAILKDQDFENISSNKVSLKDIESILKSESIGTLVYPSNVNLSKSKFKNIVQLSNKYKIPVLFSKSTYPYKTIGILVNNDFESNSPNTISFDLSNSMSCSVLAVNVSKPKFLQNEDQSILKSTLEKLQNLALAQNTNFLIEQTEGNEAKVFSELSTKFELSVLGISTNNWQERKILDYVTKSSNSSVLYIPK